MAEIEDMVEEAHEQYRQAKLDVLRRNFRSTLMQIADVLVAQADSYRVAASTIVGQRSSSDLRQAMKTAEEHREYELQILRGQLKLNLVDMIPIEKDAP